jgi:6-phosphogluconolactonase
MMFVYVGTYSVRGGGGIYLYSLDISSGALSLINSFPSLENPTFLAINHSGENLYAVSEVPDPYGAVSSFSIHPVTGELKHLNNLPVLGGSPCHLSVDATDSFILGANYDGGSAFVLSIEKYGRLGHSTSFVQHKGMSLDSERQEGPHTHSVTLDHSNRYAFVADLGIDRIMIYEFDPETGTLSVSKQGWIDIKPGAGPRHFTFHPNGKYAYVINELDSTVTSLTYDQSKGKLRCNGIVSTLPPGVDLPTLVMRELKGNNWCADIHISPSGTKLYGSNRGHDSIAIFDIDLENGKLNYRGYEPSGGETPRGFVIDQTGKILIAANQDSDNIATFFIDIHTGLITPTGHSVEVPSPVCLKIK